MGQVAGAASTHCPPALILVWLGPLPSPPGASPPPPWWTWDMGTAPCPAAAVPPGSRPAGLPASGTPTSGQTRQDHQFTRPDQTSHQATAHLRPDQTTLQVRLVRGGPVHAAPLPLPLHLHRLYHAGDGSSALSSFSSCLPLLLPVLLLLNYTSTMQGGDSSQFYLPLFETVS